MMFILYAELITYLNCGYLFFYSSVAMRTETAPDETPLPEDSVAAVDEEPVSVKVPFRPFLPPGLNMPKWVASRLVSPSIHAACFQSCSLSFPLVLRTQQCLRLSKTLVV